MTPGDKFYFKHDTKQELFTVKAVSADGEMIESDEIGGWSWADGAISVSESFVGESWLSANKVSDSGR